MKQKLAAYLESDKSILLENDDWWNPEKIFSISQNIGWTSDMSWINAFEAVAKLKEVN